MVKRESLVKKPARFTERPPTSGRKPGTPNRTTRILKEAIILAAEQVGEDKSGKGQLVGYLKRIAKYHPSEFCVLLGKVLPMQITGDNGGPVKVTFSRDEAQDFLQQKGIMVEGIFDQPVELLPPPRPKPEDAKVINAKAMNGHSSEPKQKE